MARKSKKERRAKKRKEIKKRKRTQKKGLPALLRKDPLPQLNVHLDAGKDAIPEETLNRIGEIKNALITFSRDPEFEEDLEEALIRRFGKPERPESKEVWANFQDWFVLEYELEEGDTVIERFWGHYHDFMSDDVRRLVSGWQMGYLESNSVSDLPFRKVAERYPLNFSKVIAYYKDMEGFSSENIDDLLMEFKPETFEKIPRVVAIPDSEMAELARSVKQEPNTPITRLKDLFKKK